MKNITRALALLLALILVLGLVVTGFAEGAGAAGTGYTITVNNAIGGQIYNLYKILDLSVSEDKEAFSYTVNSQWNDFFKSAGEGTAAGAGLTYVDINDQGYVTWKTTKASEAEYAAFARAAEEFAKTKPLTALSTETITAGSTTQSFTFTVTDPGYYLITSTLGTKAIVDTTPTNPNATVQEKNQAPSNEKLVKENSTGIFGKVNDADIGDTIDFQSTITVQAGAENYVFHDEMSVGLTFKSNSIVVKKNGTIVNENSYTIKTKDGTDDTKTNDTTCTFEIAFNQSFLDSLSPNDSIVITYSAELNNQATIGATGNTNTSKVSYGDKNHTSTTPPSTTTTYTWGFEVLKHATDDETKLLKDAKFVLLNEGKTQVAKFDTDGKFTGWENKPAEGQQYGNSSILVTDQYGKIKIEGIDSAKYYLSEIEAPAGYNKLKDDKLVEIKTTTTNGTENTATMTMEELTVKVANSTGTELPSTGGIGTTVFYVVGGILAVGAAVLLVTKKRMERG